MSNVLACASESGRCGTASPVLFSSKCKRMSLRATSYMLISMASYTSTLPPFARTGQPFASSVAAARSAAVSTE